MNKKIALLRGINVGGHKKILMTDLRLLFERLGFKNVRSYIQSGNIIFDTSVDKDEIDVEVQIEAAIKEQFGFDVPVIVRSKEELESLVNNNPFVKGGMFDDPQLFLTCLKSEPKAEDRIITENFRFEPDQFSIDRKDIYMVCMGKYHLSKLSNTFFESKLKVGATTRGWKTILKLLELSK